MSGENGKHFDWTHERVEDLKRLVADGMTYAQIGALWGISRNAALGKAHRLGLWVGQHGGKRMVTKTKAARVPQAAKQQRARPLVVPRSNVPAKRVRSAAEREGTKAPWRSKADFNGGVPLDVGTSMKILAGDAWDALPGSRPVPLEAHKTGCRWPIGDPLQPGFGLCNEATGGKTYCEAHRARAYTTSPT